MNQVFERVFKNDNIEVMRMPDGRFRVEKSLNGHLIQTLNVTKEELRQILEAAEDGATIINMEVVE